LDTLSQQSAAWEAIGEDIREIERYLGEELGPKTAEEKEHAGFTSLIASNIENLSSMEEPLHQAALTRRSLG